jgi:TetR/AcrR family transcriptional regulator
MPRVQGARRQQILETLATELERNPGARITTARLAQALEVSEAALYRHFPSKARMYEGLIGFAEESVYNLFARILREEAGAARRCERLVGVLLGFAARNPGITRVLLGDALVGEHERLRGRVGQFFDRCETQLRQVLNQHELDSGRRLALPASVAANLLLAFCEGRMVQFLRSEFRHRPDADWARIWPAIEHTVFGAPQAGSD